MSDPVCYRHPDRETRVSCSSCDRPICPDCMTPTPVGMRCPECARERTKVVSGPGAGLAAAGPFVTYAMIGACVLVYLGQVATGAGGMPPDTTGVLRSLALQAYAIDQGGDVWRIVTSGFVHIGPFHLAINMFILWILGSLLEPMIGHARFAAIYAVSLVAGSVGALLLTSPLAITAGASGAVYGLFGAAFLIARERGLEQVMTQIGLLIVINLVFTFSVPGISIGGHLGGLAGGALAAGVLIQAGRAGLRGSSGLSVELGILGLVAAVLFVVAIVVAGLSASDVSPFIAPL